MSNFATEQEKPQGVPSAKADASTRDGHATIFSSREFVNAWCDAFGDCEPLGVQVNGSGPSRTMYLVKTPLNYGSCRISGPRAHDLWASPGWSGELTRSTVDGILRQLRGTRTRSLHWQVRFDHEPLTAMLKSLGLVGRPVQIHVLALDREYDALLAGYSATTRNHIRKAARRGIVVRSSDAAPDILAYHSLYSKHAQDKHWRFEYPARLTMELVKRREEACFKVVEWNGSIVGGALFLRDGNSVYYLHGIGDRDHNQLYPASAALDAGIQWACEIGAEFFNFGNSGIESVNNSLAAFKASWGATVAQNWLFDWDNPLWKWAAKLRSQRRRKSEATVDLR